MRGFVAVPSVLCLLAVRISYKAVFADTGVLTCFNVYL
jgi:hypothetical protein